MLLAARVSAGIGAKHRLAGRRGWTQDGERDGSVGAGADQRRSCADRHGLARREGLVRYEARAVVIRVTLELARVVPGLRAGDRDLPEPGHVGSAEADLSERRRDWRSGRRVHGDRSWSSLRARGDDPDQDRGQRGDQNDTQTLRHHRRPPPTLTGHAIGHALRACGGRLV